MATPKEVTDRMIRGMERQGVQVIDARGMLPINDNPAHRYGMVPGGLAGVKNLLLHWTGDRFTTDILRQLGLPDVGADGMIDATWTEADERKMLTWYADFHIGKDGGVWGGLAYGTVSFPSGRVWVVWNVGTLTYHAFNANAVSYALCCPISNEAAPTVRQVAGLKAALDMLCFETPEIPARHGDVYGHQEATFIDRRNTTACPGPQLLAWVRRYRAGLVTPPIGGPDPIDAKLEATWLLHRSTVGEKRFSATLARPDWYMGKALFCERGIVTPDGLLDPAGQVDDLVTYWEASNVLIRH